VRRWQVSAQDGCAAVGVGDRVRVRVRARARARARVRVRVRNSYPNPSPTLTRCAAVRGVPTWALLPGGGECAAAVPGGLLFQA
jgi:hypothetical protein